MNVHDTFIKLRQVGSHPGLSSPLFMGSLLLGASLFFFRKDETDFDRAFYALSVAGTAMLTKNTQARCCAVVGGIMRACSSTGDDLFGLTLQLGAIAYAVKEEIGKIQMLR